MDDGRGNADRGRLVDDPLEVGQGHDWRLPVMNVAWFGFNLAVAWRLSGARLGHAR